MDLIKVKGLDINCFLVALYLTSTCVSSIISSFIAIPFISVILVLLVVVGVILNNPHLTLLKMPLIYFFIFLLVLLTSSLINGTENVINYFFHFVVFGISSLLISNIQVDTRKTLYYLLLIYFLYILVYLLKIQYFFVDDYADNQMGLAYSFVPGVLIGFLIILSRNYFNRKTRLLALFVLICSLGVILFKTVTRGAILSVLVGFYLLILLKSKTELRKIIILCSLLFIPIFVYIVPSIIDSLGHTSVGALNKLLIMLEDGGDVSNGRNQLYNSAIQLFYNNPIIGNGVGLFEDINNTYVHQIFLEMLCEVGILGSCVFLYPLVHKVVNVFKARVSLDKSFFLIYFTYSIVLLLFSNAFWLLPSFWFIFFNTKLVSE